MIINLSLRGNWNDSFRSPCLFTTSADGSTAPSLSEKIKEQCWVNSQRKHEVPDKENESKRQPGHRNSHMSDCSELLIIYISVLTEHKYMQC